LVQWSYGGQANQKWNVTLVSGNKYKITSAYNGLAVDAVTGGQLVLHPYSGVSTQLWTLQANDDTSYYNLLNLGGTGKAMDDWGGGLGTVVALWSSYPNATNQRWTLAAP
jgi:hypothetical protein